MAFNPFDLNRQRSTSEIAFLKRLLRNENSQRTERDWEQTDRAAGNHDRIQQKGVIVRRAAFAIKDGWACSFGKVAEQEVIVVLDAV